MEVLSSPTNVIWDVTYACPLRCIHCYSESGRRPTRQLRHEEQVKVADAIIEMRPQMVAIAGGEPLSVKGIFEVAERMSRSGIHVMCYTGGWPLRRSMVDDLVRSCDSVKVSLDGATAGVHDRVRGRNGSFERALAALGLLDEAARDAGGAGFAFGIDTVVVRSNFHQLEDICTTIAPRFPALGSLDFGAVVPAGLASRRGFEERELLSEEQVRLMGGAALERRLRSLAPPSVRVTCTDNLVLQMNPRQFARGCDFAALQIEPDGEVRAMPVYEGTVGSLLEEPWHVLWRRATQRWTDPFVVEALSSVRTMAEWADATRRIDYHFGSDSVRARIDRRPDFLGVTG
ncbi:radical SAM protein [Amycolatopsis samaneae]